MRKLILSTALIFLANISFGYVFINTVPMKAAVYLDDVYLGSSPLIVKTEVTGSHQLRFVKPGYFDSEIKVNIRDQITNIYTFLTPQTFSLYIPNQTAVRVNNQWYENDTLRNLPDGYYRFESGTNYVIINRENPNKRFLWLGLTLTCVGLVDGIIGSIQANENYDRFREADNIDDAVSYMNKSMFWDNFSTVGFAMSVLGGATSVVFAIDAAKFNARNQRMQIDSDQNAATDTSLYNKAMDFFTSGDMNNATVMFTRLIKEFNDSKYTPVALFRRAGIYQAQNRMGEAIADLEMIKTVYPIYELYAFTLKMLGDIYYAQGSYQQAIEDYNEVTLLNASARSEMDYWVIKCYDAWYKQTEDSAVLSALKERLSAFLSSPDNPESYKTELQQLNY